MRKTELGKAVRNVPLTYNVFTLDLPPSWLGAKPKAMLETMSGIGSPSILACHQSLSKGSLLSPASQRQS